MTDPLRAENNDNTTEKTVNSIKNRNILPPEMRVRVGKDKSQNTSYYDAKNKDQAKLLYHAPLKFYEVRIISFRDIYLRKRYEMVPLILTFSKPELLRVASKITWHSIGKMSGLYGTFADSLWQVIFERSLRWIDQLQ